jgi:hypothetical protein
LGDCNPSVPSVPSDDSFTEINDPDVPRNYAAAVDATTGDATSWDPNANSGVYAIAVSGSTVYLGGDFTCLGASDPTDCTTPGATQRNYAAAVFTNGSLDPNWNPNANGAVQAIAVSCSTVYLGGYFTTINDPALPRNYLAAIGTDGVVSDQWSTCAPTVTPSEVPSAAPSAVSLVAASALPAKPTGIRWSRDTRRITGRFTPTVGVTYTITATTNTTQRLQTRTTRTARGTCKVTTNKKTQKRTATCTIRLKKAGTWLVNITPTQHGISGTPATKTFKIRTPRPAATTLPPQPVTG